MRRLKLAAALTVLCAALGACADLNPRPQYPVRQETPPVPEAPPAPPPPPAPAPVVKSDDDAPKASPSTPVDQSALPPPPGAKVAPPPTTTKKTATKKSSALEPRYESGAEVLMYAASAGETSVTVGKGDTLAKISRTTGVSIDDLAKANKLEAPYRLKAGQKLVLPGAAALAPSDEAPSKETKAKPAKGKGKKAAVETAPEPKAPETVTVGKGDTLRKLAKQARMSVEDLAKANGIEAPYKLKIGQKITLGAAAEPETASSSKAESRKAAPKASAPTSVKVAKGQTLQSIADKAGAPVAELAKLNHLKKPYRVKRGQVIKLPAEGETDEAPASSSKASSSRSSSGAPKVGPVRTVTAGRRDTLQGIAEREGVSVATLAKLNHLKKPYRLKRGQKIKLPGRVIEEAPAAPTAYQVKRGDTLFSIARQFNVSPQALADANGLDLTTRLNAGRRLQLPGNGLDRPIPSAGGRLPAAPVPYSSPLSGEAPPPAQPQPSFAPPPRQTPAPEASAPAPSGNADADAAAAGKGFFQWPVKGSILSAYGPKPGNQRNDGMDISAAAGEPVRAAAAGEIVYAGNSVPGFGNLVLIRHDGGWVTVYAHLSNIDVKMRQTVTQGQQIGEVGMTGGVDQPQLHFEVRYAPNLKDKARQIDPMLVLPAQ